MGVPDHHGVRGAKRIMLQSGFTKAALLVKISCGDEQGHRASPRGRTWFTVLFTTPAGLCPCIAHRYRGGITMKILGINASPKKEQSQTRRLVLAVLEGARQAGADITFLDICSLEIRYCTACGTCYAKGECIHDDDFPALLEKMLDADGIVFGSPNYINSVTAQLKTMFDRMADSIHCQHFTGKYGCAVSTAGGSMAEEVAEYMNGVLLSLGATTVGRVGVNFMGNPEAIVPAEKKAKELGRQLADAIRTNWKDPAQSKVQAERREYFQRLVTFNKDLWNHEYEHWKMMGGR